MRRFALLLALLLASPCWGQVAIYHDDDASQTLYARIYTSDSAAVAVALTAGTSGNTRRYKVTDAAVTSAGISADGSYPFTIFSGTPSTSASDTARGSGVLVWIDGASARDLAAGDSVVLSNSTLDSMWTRWMQTATADGGASTYGRALHYLRGAFSAASVFSEEALAEAPHGTGGGGGDPIAPITISKQRTWRPSGLDASKAENIVTVKAPFTGTLAVEMPLNPEADIDSVDDVDVTPPSGTVTATNLMKTADGRTVHFDVPTLTTVGTYEVVPTVTTLDGQEISMACVLIVR